MPDIADARVLPQQLALIVKHVKAGAAVVADDHLVQAVAVEIASPYVVHATAAGVGPQQVAIRIVAFHRIACWV